jgi:hypothetical protein
MQPLPSTAIPLPQTRPALVWAHTLGHHENRTEREVRVRHVRWVEDRDAACGPLLIPLARIRLARLRDVCECAECRAQARPRSLARRGLGQLQLFERVHAVRLCLAFDVVRLVERELCVPERNREEVVERRADGRHDVALEQRVQRARAGGEEDARVRVVVVVAVRVRRRRRGGGRRVRALEVLDDARRVGELNRLRGCVVYERRQRVVRATVGVHARGRQAVFERGLCGAAGRGPVRCVGKALEV